MICIIDFAQEHVLSEKSVHQVRNSRDRETMGKFVHKAKTKRSLWEKYHEMKYLISSDTYWCLSSDLFLRIPRLGWLVSSSMFNNFPTNNFVTLTQFAAGNNLILGIGDNPRECGSRKILAVKEFFRCTRRRIIKKRSYFRFQAPFPPVSRVRPTSAGCCSGQRLVTEPTPFQRSSLTQSCPLQGTNKNSNFPTSIPDLFIWGSPSQLY